MITERLPRSLAQLQQRIHTPPPLSSLQQTLRLFQGVAPEPPRLPPAHARLRSAAVALIFAQTQEDTPLELLVIQRAARKGDPWSGHMGLPGGRRDPEDTSLLETAIRETAEEIGIVLTPQQSIGAMPAHFAGGNLRKVMWVYPFLFGLDGKPALQPNREVADALWIPLSHLYDPAARGWMLYPWRGLSLPFPCVRYQERLIWGLTLRILQTLGASILR